MTTGPSPSHRTGDAREDPDHGAGVPPIFDTNAFSRENMPDLAPYSFAVTPGEIGAAIEAVLSDVPGAVARTEATWEEPSGIFSLEDSVRQIVMFATLREMKGSLVP